MARSAGPEAYRADGRKLDRLRLAKGWTKPGLSTKARVNHKTLNRALRGERTTRKAICALARALQIPNWLELVNLDLEPELAGTLAETGPATIHAVPPASAQRNTPASRRRKTSGTLAPALGKRKRGLGSPVSLSAEDLLQELAAEATRAVEADSCSIFMWDDDAALYVLRESESPLLKPFLGRLFLDHTVNARSPKCGITNRCASTAALQLVTDVHEDPAWSQNDHCELPADQLRSLIAVPIAWQLPSGFSPPRATVTEQRPRGILRVVRSKAKPPFRTEHGGLLDLLQNDYSPTLSTSESFARLMSVGLTLSTEEMCRRATEILGQLVRAKGCSIFLLDDLRPDVNGQRTYRCFGSTGLHVWGTRHSRRPVDLHEAMYTVPLEEREHLTAFVISKKRNVVIDDVQVFDFERELEMVRKPGSGNYCETFAPEPAKRSGPFMAAPLFFRERFDPSFPALGAIRVARPAGSQPFGEAEQRRFFALAEQLAKAILRSRYHELLEAISLSPPDQPFERIAQRVVAEVPMLLGGSGCSLWLGNPKLEMKATFGRLEREFREGNIGAYDIRDKKTRGMTGAVVASGEAICYNSIDERKRLAKEKGIVWSGRTQCEIDVGPENVKAGPIKLAVVPIVSRGQAIGAIRVPKSAVQIPFSPEEDIPMLAAIGRHIGAIVGTNHEPEERGGRPRAKRRPRRKR